MKTLIVYATKYGTSEKCANLLKERLDGEVELRNIKTDKHIDVSGYDKVIIGGSIYMGRIQKQIQHFSSLNKSRLKKKKLGIYICCMREGDIAETELIAAFDPELLSGAVVMDYFGGEFQFKKMNFLDRFIVRKVSKIEQDYSNLRLDHISRFAEQMNASS